MEEMVSETNSVRQEPCNKQYEVQAVCDMI